MSILLGFVVILTVIVFVHELGHYAVARLGGVRVEVFSIGFGPELAAWVDRHGTRWRIAAVPLGGYVKFFGDMNAASAPGDDEALAALTPAERAVAFPLKPLSVRAAVVAAGPAANLIFAVLALAVLFAVAGKPVMPAVVGTVQPDSAAAAAGLAQGDRILAVDGEVVADFNELTRLVRERPGREVRLDLRRADGRQELLTVALRSRLDAGPDGAQRPVGLLGVTQQGVEYLHVGPVAALGEALAGVGFLLTEIARGLGEMLAGSRPADDMAGPIGIAKMSGEVWDRGAYELIGFMVFLSVNLGIVNLLPIPILDGGHLLMYAIEALRGRPLGARAMETGFRIGLVLVLALMVKATWNDLDRLKFFDYIRSLLS